MSKWIDIADAIKIMACEMYAEAQSQGYDADGIEDFIPEAKAWINDAPTIDAVSVVRCKECKWAKANGTYQWCGRLDSTARITADDYCSYGEREGE